MVTRGSKLEEWAHSGDSPDLGKARSLKRTDPKLKAEGAGINAFASSTGSSAAAQSELESEADERLHSECQLMRLSRV
jgi:hypothetical protein